MHASDGMDGSGVRLRACRVSRGDVQENKSY